MPRISIITPCYNAQKFIERTVESVRDQTFTDWEHIIVDDGSTDNSTEVVQSLLPRESRLRLIQQTNRGRASACNRGVQACSPKSEYLLFLDADDCLTPQMLEVLSRHLDQNVDVGIAYCEHAIIDENDNFLDKKQYDYLGPRYAPAWLGARELPSNVLETPFNSIFTLNVFICTVGLIRRSVYECTPGWDETFGFLYDDTDLLFNIAIRSKVHYIPQALARYRRHGTQDTATSAPLREPGQRQKLYNKWLNTTLPEEQRKTLVASNRFLQGSLPLYLGLKRGNSHLRQQDFYLAAQNYYGAARRYLIYLFHRLDGRIK